LIEDDQPCLVEDEVRHFAEPILLLAHADRERLLRADVDIDYERTVPLLDPAASDVVFKRLLIEKGDVHANLARADRVIEGTYRTGAQEHVYIEPNGVIAVPGADGGMTLHGSLQCPYYVHKALKVLLTLTDEKVRVVQ